MFWGLVIHPGKRYQTEVTQPFRVTKACIVPSSCVSKEVSTVFLETDNSEEFILANLSLSHLNETLEISFNEGENICFKVSGQGVVHLSGNFLDLMNDESGSDEDEDSEEEMMDELKNLNWTKQQIKQMQGVDSESDDENVEKIKRKSKSNDTNNKKPNISNKSKNQASPTKESKVKPDSKSENDTNIKRIKNETISRDKGNKKPNIPNDNKNHESPAKESKEKPGGKTDVISEAKPKKVVKAGVVIEDLVEGTGVVSKNGNGVGMYYRGRLQSSKKAFDSCLSGKPFRFKLGAGKVIKGWDVGLQGMKVGGKRRLTIPPAMGYGKRGAPPDIPPNSTLVFDVECKFIYGGVQY